MVRIKQTGWNVFAGRFGRFADLVVRVCENIFNPAMRINS